MSIKKIKEEDEEIDDWEYEKKLEEELILSEEKKTFNLAKKNKLFFGDYEILQKMANRSKFFTSLLIWYDSKGFLTKKQFISFKNSKLYKQIKK